MRWWPRLAPSRRPASYRDHTCTIYILLHYTPRCGIAVHVSMFSSVLMRLMTSPTDCELDGSWIIQTVHLHCCDTLLFNYKTQFKTKFSTLFCESFVIIVILRTSRRLKRHTCTYVLACLCLLLFRHLRHIYAYLTYIFDMTCTHVSRCTI